MNVGELKRKLENIDDDVEVLIQLDKTIHVSEFSLLFGRDTELLDVDEKEKVVYLRGFNG